MKDLKKNFKDKEIKNLNMIKGGGDDEPIDKRQIKKQNKK